MQINLLRLLTMGVTTTMLTGCLFDSKSDINQENNPSPELTRDQASLFTLSLDGGNSGLCTSLSTSNCRDYFAFAPANIYTKIDEATVATTTPPPQYILTADKISQLAASIPEGESWNPDVLNGLTQILNWLVDNPQAPNNVYDCVKKGACEHDLRDQIVNSVFNGAGDRARYGEEPAGFGDAVLDGYEDVWTKFSDAEYETFLAVFRVGEEPKLPTYTFSESTIANLIAAPIWSTANVQSDISNLASALLGQSELQKSEVETLLAQVDLGSVKVLQETANIGQTVFDLIEGEDGGFGDSGAEPWDLYSGYHIGSESRYSITQDDFDYVDSNRYTTDASFEKEVAILKIVAATVSNEFTYGVGGDYADREAAYGALKSAFLAVEAIAIEADGAAVFAAQETHYPDYPGEPDDLYSHLHIGSQSTYSLKPEDFDYLRGESTADTTLIDQTIAVLEILGARKSTYEYGSGKEYADRAEAYAALASDFQAVEIIETVYTLNNGRIVLDNLSNLEEDALYAYLLDRESGERKREVAAAANSIGEYARNQYSALVKDAQRIGGEETKVGILTINNANPYESFDAYGTLFELEGIDFNWIPVSAATVLAQGEANECANLSLYVAQEANQAALEIEYADLFAQHLEACQSPSIAGTMIADLDGIFITGGDQNLGMDALLDSQAMPTELLTAIRDKYHAGQLTLAGTSAGTAITAGENMFAGGSALNALRDGEADLSSVGGLGVFSFGLIDSHTQDRGRIARIAVALEQTGERYGFGVNAAGSLNVRTLGDGTVEMLARGEGFFILDSVNASSLAGFNLHLLSDGDIARLNPESNEISIEFASSKNASSDAGYDASAGAFTSSKDALDVNAVADFIFGTYLAGYTDRILEMETPLTDSNGDAVAPEYKLVFTRTESSQVVSNNKEQHAFSNFQFDIVTL